MTDLRVALATHPLAMSTASLHRVNALLDSGFPLSRGSATLRIDAAKRGPPALSRSGRTAVIEVRGFISQRPSILEAFGLGTSCQAISAQLRTALADPSIDRIVVDFASEGGECFGCTELFGEIMDSRGVKPTIAIANSVCASAALWIGSACSQVFVTPGGQVGGIGAVVQHVDERKALEMAGIKVTIMSAGKFKAETASSAALSREAKAHMQQMVDGIGKTFIRDVAMARGFSPATVRRDFGEGRVMRGADAVRIGMVDGIATLDDVLGGRAKKGQR